MKKVIIIAAAAALALVACTKTDQNALFSNQEMVFSPNALSTKALILPDSNSPENLDFPTTETFNVFAFSALDGANYNYGKPLMKDVNISYQGGDWKATTGTYLWPNSGNVDFYAYHPASLPAVFDSTATPKGLTIPSVDLGSVVGSQIDPLTASTIKVTATTKPTVSLVFKHITSQIAVTAFDATTTSTLQGKISIEKVVFNNMKTTGDYREGTSIGQGQWTNPGGNANFVPFLGSKILETSENFLSGGSFAASIDNSAAFVVIPVDVINAASGQSIDVTYSIAEYDINGFHYPATASQTVNIPLYNKISGNKFQNGKRYVFHLGISLDGANNEIMFSPKVTGWDTEDITGITVDAINATLM